MCCKDKLAAVCSPLVVLYGTNDPPKMTEAAGFVKRGKSLTPDLEFGYLQDGWLSELAMFRTIGLMGLTWSSCSEPMFPCMGIKELVGSVLLNLSGGDSIDGGVDGALQRDGERVRAD